MARARPGGTGGTGSLLPVGLMPAPPEAAAAENVRSSDMSTTDGPSAKRAVHTGSELGPYSAAVVAGEHCYVAGMGGFKPGTREIVEGGIEAETKTTLDNLAATLRQAGFRLEDVVSATCYLRDLSNWPVFNEVLPGLLWSGIPGQRRSDWGQRPAGRGERRGKLRGLAGRGAGGSCLEGRRRRKNN